MATVFMAYVEPGFSVTSDRSIRPIVPIQRQPRKNFISIIQMTANQQDTTARRRQEANVTTVIVYTTLTPDSVDLPVLVAGPEISSNLMSSVPITYIVSRPARIDKRIS